MSFIALGVTGTVTAATAIAGASALAGAGLGAASMISGNKQQRRAQEALERQAQNSPLYKPDKSIDAYYQEAMNRYRENPYQSQQYQVGQRNIQRATAQGVSALQDRRSAIGGIGRLQANQMGAMQNLGAQAEASRQQRLGQFGQATQLKSSDYQRQFDINEMTPYNRQLQLEQMKAQAAGERYNTGMQMLGQGVSAIGTIAGSGGFKGVGGTTKTNAVNTDLGFGNTTGSPYGKFTDSPKIDYSKYWKPTKTFK
jgi:hypothetical protein